MPFVYHECDKYLQHSTTQCSALLLQWQCALCTMWRIFYAWKMYSVLFVEDVFMLSMCVHFRCRHLILRFAGFSLYILIRIPSDNCVFQFVCLFIFYFVLKMHMHMLYGPFCNQIGLCVFYRWQWSTFFVNYSSVKKIKNKPKKREKIVIYIYIVNYTLIGCHVVHYIIRERVRETLIMHIA